MDRSGLWVALDARDGPEKGVQQHINVNQSS